MKKRLLLTLLAAPLILTSCGEAESAKSDEQSSSIEGQESSEQEQSGDDSTQTPADSSVTAEPTRAEMVEALFADMAEGASTTFVDPTLGTTEYYGDDVGFLRIYSELALGYGAQNGGVLKIDNYGLFEFSYDADFSTVDGYQVLSTNTALDISDVTYTTKDLGLAADTATFSEGMRTHTFSTSDSEFCMTLGFLMGYDDETLSLYPTKKAEFRISDDGQTIYNLSLHLSGAADKSNEDTSLTGYKIEKVGKTFDLGVQAFLVEPPSFVAAGMWLNSSTVEFGQIHPNFSVPFPTGSTWATIEGFDSKGRFMFYDYKCGDKTATYKAQIETAGFTVNEEETDAAQKLFVYEKTIAEASDTSREVRQVIAFTYFNDAETLALHPAGQFVIMSYAYQVYDAVTGNDANAFLETHRSYADPSQPIVPHLDLGATIGVECEDYTAEVALEYPECDELFYGNIYISYATYEDALDALESIIDQLVADGYEDYSYEGYYYGYDFYLIKEETGTSYKCEVFGAIQTDDDGNYVIVFVVDHYGYGY